MSKVTADAKKLLLSSVTTVPLGKMSAEPPIRC